MFDDRDMCNYYDSDLWPGVSVLVVFEIAKRSWCMFKMYLSNVAADFGWHSNFVNMHVEEPTPVDDEV